MPYANEQAGDFDKLRQAYSEISGMFGSTDDLLSAFGLADMPMAQRYGIMFGCIVFVCTVSAVVGLLILGGSFKRIQEQAETGQATLLSPQDVRAQRALLLERLLESRERLLQNYPEPTKTRDFTNLTTMLMNVAPNTHEIAQLVQEDNGKKNKKKQEIRRYIPPHYEQNYVEAYRKCQDRPGGAVLAGRPEAREEAYARAFAGCGPYASAAYRRSYGRLYEAIACKSHMTDDNYMELWKTRPQDIVGRFVRLEPLEAARHLDDLHKVTSGAPALENKGYDPDEVWGFQEDGPFEEPKEMLNSFVFERLANEASFAIVHSVTQRVMGCILLTHDDPKFLTIQMECPIVQPFREGSKEQLEACFLLMDRLFAYGYRRIQISLDSQDIDKRKLAVRLGFTLEGTLYKHMVLKEASRDSIIYGMLNNDWNKGARGSIFRKLYGVPAHRADAANEKREEELDEQTRFLAKQKLEEEAAAAAGGADKKKV